MEITKCSDNSQTIFQHFNYGYSKSCHSQSGSLRALAIKSLRTFAIKAQK
jgi:hypothetical protein